MPQTDHLTFGGGRRASSLPQLHTYQNGGQLKSCLKKSSSVTQNGYTAVKQSEMKKSKVVVNAAVNSNTKTSLKEEKHSQFSVRWEIQLSAFVLICFFIVLVIPTSMIVMGSVYIFDCPKEVMIPVFLIVSGSTFIASVYGLRKLSAMKKTTNNDVRSYESMFWTLILFQIGWFIAGCYWTYRVYEPKYHPDSQELHCDKTLYQYTFWLLNSAFIVLGLIFVGFVGFLVWGLRKPPTSAYHV